MTVAALTFEESTHTYMLGTRVLPSVTQVLRGVGIVPLIDAPVAAQRGTDVHLACHFDDLGILDESSVDDTIAPFVEQYRLFKKASGFRVLQSEQRVWSDAFGFAGTLDKIGVLWDGAESIVDLKTKLVRHPPERWYGYQLAGYDFALTLMGYEQTRRRYTLTLTPKTYDLDEFKSSWDRKVFESSVIVFYALNGERLVL